MRKSSPVLLAFICGALVICAPLPAAAYVYAYHPGVPGVVVDTSVLTDDQPASPPQEQGPVAADDAEQPSAPAGSIVAAAPVAPVDLAPVPHKLAKPFFTSDGSEPDVQPPAAEPIQPLPVPHRHEEASAPAPVVAPPVAEEAVPAVKAVEAAPATEEPAPAPNPMGEWLAPENKASTEKVAEDKAPEEKAAEVKPTVAVAPVPEETKAPAETKQAAADINAADKKAESEPAVPSHSDLTVEFDGTSSTLNSAAQSKLDTLANQIKDSDMRMQLRGFAKGDASDQSSARRMALSRALAVRAYLMDKGIKAVRLDVRALGSETDQMPIDRVDLVFVK